MEKVKDLIIRYIILLLISIPNVKLFYFLFSFLTTYSVFFILSFFSNPILEGTTIIINSFKIELIDACIAGSAYFLLFALNILTPIKLKKRIFSLLFLFSSFFVINVVRIILFSFFLLKVFSLYKTLHLIFWYLLSSFIVACLWFLNIKIFGIKEIPFYSDAKFLIRVIKSRKKIKKTEGG